MSRHDVPPELLDDWIRACNDVYRVLRQGRSRVGRLGEGETLTEAQVAVLDSVAQRGALPVGEIARHAGIAQPTVTRMLNSLEARGIVIRRPADHDDRVTLVELTGHGVEMWEVKRRILRDLQEDSLLRFPPESREQVVSVLQQFVQIVESQISPK
ncbi:MarR family winged helix-turn-helix transcriptional regulator [Paenarthrobacter sp. NPDC056912]|uniref:MarR family winged helix-turn-helix transcriptional regulator n=1 Tax=Paenarthrobacter sp. NPDC056912 TaxID=3345965 RepID=UPI00366F3E6E